LVDSRRLGQTNLQVGSGALNTSSATAPRNLGLFNYAHLRGTLPENLQGSGIFDANAHPESYFLMRRSSDGFISATGMFKLAFPWATREQEESERNYFKSLPGTSPDESAGNSWIPPKDGELNKGNSRILRLTDRFSPYVSRRVRSDTLDQSASRQCYD
jgi:hypothetical protein